MLPVAGRSDEGPKTERTAAVREGEPDHAVARQDDEALLAAASLDMRWNPARGGTAAHRHHHADNPNVRTTQMNIRPARQDDLNALWNFLAMAAFEPDAAAARALPIVAAHLLGWQRPTDFGVIADLDGDAVGAAWARQLGEQDNPFYVDDRTLEISAAVCPDARGRGIGTALLCALIDEAKLRGLGLCLNVRETNPAFRLYERLGFRRVPGWKVRNRTGTLSIGMVLDVAAQ